MRSFQERLSYDAFGRPESPDDEPFIEEMLDDFRDSDFRFQELILSLVTSRLFLQDREG